MNELWHGEYEKLDITVECIPAGQRIFVSHLTDFPRIAIERSPQAFWIIETGKLLEGWPTSDSDVTVDELRARVHRPYKHLPNVAVLLACRGKLQMEQIHALEKLAPLCPIVGYSVYADELVPLPFIDGDPWGLVVFHSCTLKFLEFHLGIAREAGVPVWVGEGPFENRYSSRESRRMLAFADLPAHLQLRELPEAMECRSTS